MNGLNVIEKWIEKMPDGSKPNQFMKKSIVEILYCFNCDQDLIPKSNLGKFLMSIYKNDSKNETDEIRKSAKSVIDKWSRSLLNNKINYQKEYNYDDNEIKEQKKQKIKDQNQKISFFDQRENNRYVKIPAQKQFDFVINPKSNVPTNYRSKELSEESKEIYKLLLNKKKNK